MAKSILQSSKRSQRVALGFVVVTTALSIVAAGLTAYDDLTYENLHRFALVVMLVAYVAYIAVVLSGRSRSVGKINAYDDGESVFAVPTTIENFVSIRVKQPDSKVLGALLARLRSRRRQAVRVVLVRDAHLDQSFLGLLSQFPNVAILDLQGCTIDRDFWDELVHLHFLRCVLANNSVDASLLKEISYALPEIKFWLEPRTVQAASEAPTPKDGRQLVRYD